MRSRLAVLGHLHASPALPEVEEIARRWVAILPVEQRLAVALKICAALCRGPRPDRFSGYPGGARSKFRDQPRVAGGLE